jgi:hypothetical protein
MNTTPEQTMVCTMTQTESYQCAACEAAIPPGHVVTTTDERLGTRDVVAYCVCCKRAYQAGYILAGGVWMLDGRVNVLTRGRVYKSIQAYVGKQLGDVQLAMAG